MEHTETEVRDLADVVNRMARRSGHPAVVLMGAMTLLGMKADHPALDVLELFAFDQENLDINEASVETVQHYGLLNRG